MTLKALHSQLFLVLFFLVPLCTNAQDIHFSQFYNVPLHLSPALTGIFPGDMRFNANYRAQWYDVPVTYRTAYVSFEKKWYTCEERTHFWAIGGVFDYDWAGDSDLSTGQLAIMGSYTHMLTRKNHLTAGVQLSGYQRSFDPQELQFDAQYNGKQYDPFLSNRETFADQTIFYADFGVGLNYLHRNPEYDKRSELSIGAGYFHINTPKKSFFDNDEVQLPARWVIHALGTLQFSRKWDGLLRAFGEWQGPHTEYIVGGAAKYHLNIEKTKELAILLGLSYRFNAEGLGTGDAIIPNIEIHNKAWIFGLSYDINVSDFNVATNNFGGPEFSVQYIFRKSLEEFCPTCPTYL